MFFLIFSIIDIIAGALMMMSSPVLKGSEFVYWVSITLLLKGIIMMINDKFAKGKYIPWGSIFDVVIAAALFGVSGGFLLPIYFALGILMAGKGVWGFLGSMTGG